MGVQIKELYYVDNGKLHNENEVLSSPYIRVH